MSKKPETLFKEKVLRDLKTLSKSYFFKVQLVSLRGIPDIMGCMVGTCVVIELKKSAEEELEPLQTWTINRFRSAGAIGIEAHPDNWQAHFDALKRIHAQALKERG